jgi:DNA-binding HxlR family transcriptional regulator
MTTQALDDTPACSVARTLDIIGERWTLLILRDLLVGMTRNDEIARDLGIASNVLALRLQTLVEHSLIAKEVSASDARAYTYTLTARGRELYPVLLALTAWGDKWLAAPGAQPLLVVHTGCGQVTAAVPCCAQCLEPLDLAALRFVAGPGGREGPRTGRIGHYLERKV